MRIAEDMGPGDFCTEAQAQAAKAHASYPISFRSVYFLDSSAVGKLKIVRLSDPPAPPTQALLASSKLTCSLSSRLKGGLGDYQGRCRSDLACKE